MIGADNSDANLPGYVNSWNSMLDELVSEKDLGLKVAHPLMLRAIAAAKKKNDRIDAVSHRCRRLCASELQ
jgi:hypothetical protein